MRIEIKRLHQRRHDDRLRHHDQIEAMTLATDRRDERRELRRSARPARSTTGRPTSSSPGSWLAGHEPARRQGVGEGGARRCIVLARSEQRAIVLPVPGQRRRGQARETARKVIFGIRPEAINDRESVDRNAKAVAAFNAQGRDRRAGRVGHLCRDTDRRQGGDRAHARRHRRARRRDHAFAFNLDKAVLFDPATARRFESSERRRRVRLRDRRRAGGRAPAVSQRGRGWPRSRETS